MFNWYTEIVSWLDPDKQIELIPTQSKSNQLTNPKEKYAKG